MSGISWGKKSSFAVAVENLIEALGPDSRILATQDFRHTSQEEGESVAAFIRRLEQMFQVAYGKDHLKLETRDAFLYGQLQEELCHGLMKSLNVSGALEYKQLCMATKMRRDTRLN